MKIHWVNWKTLCVSKKHGGMGLRDLNVFHLALLAKQGWILMQNTCSISIGVFKKKYCSHCSFMEAQSHQNRIIRVGKYFKGNISYLLSYVMEIGSGESLSKW